MLNKIGLIGGGYIGGVLTQEIAQRRLAREVGLSDPAPFVNPDDPPERQEVQKKQSVAKGKALDITYSRVDEDTIEAVLSGVRGGDRIYILKRCENTAKCLPGSPGQDHQQ